MSNAFYSSAPASSVLASNHPDTTTPLDRAAHLQQVRTSADTESPAAPSATDQQQQRSGDPEHDYHHDDYDAHRRAWEELARSIAALGDRVSEVPDGQVLPNSQPGELTIIGSGIETVGFSVGDQRLLESADKVLYCVADPATIVWLRRLRPDALDLYVLYGDDKIRYTTYMQMAEAQLYWVRQGLRVVVVFYGHPGIFVLSTHRAIRIARREGHRAIMKAGVSALDTLCADLGVDPSHPGLQTHEATDALSRRRRIDTTLHVVLWQVGLIGELGYRRQGYLNANFSYFVRWLQDLYGEHYPITHYIGSRYPSVEPLIEEHPLSALHEPEAQSRITGLSTFYIAPRDSVPTDADTVRDLGLLRDGERLVAPTSPLREIARYGSRERAAFRAFAKFSIPTSYRWQGDTAASDFLIVLRFDPELQASYREDPIAALAQPRFDGLSDRERALLASRDAGAIQVAAKGAYVRSPGNERLITNLLSSRTLAGDLLRRLHAPRAASRTQASATGQWQGWSEAASSSAAGGQGNANPDTAIASWVAAQHGALDRARFHASVDWMYRNAAFPWTGVYVDELACRLVVLLGHSANRAKSLLYVDGQRVRSFRFSDGVIRWRAGPEQPCHGALRLDLQGSGRRRLLGKTWLADQGPESAQDFSALAADPGRRVSGADPLSAMGTLPSGVYALRSSGRFARDIASLRIGQDGVWLDGVHLPQAQMSSQTIAWSGGSKDWHAARLQAVSDPLTGSVELYGHSRSRHEPGLLQCHGARVEAHSSHGASQSDAAPSSRDLGQLARSLMSTEAPVPDWALEQLARIAGAAQSRGGLLLWHKWEKATFTHKVLTTQLMPRI